MFLAACAMGQVKDNPQPGQISGRSEATMAYWKFDGDLKDASGRGHDISAGNAKFAAGYSGQALQAGARGSVGSSADLELAPGLKIDLWVRFECYSPGYHAFVRKEQEYMIRADPDEEGGEFSFFVYLNGWGPRVSSKVKPEPGAWYHLVAQWDGFNATLEVNGEKTSVQRLGMPKPGGRPLEISTMDGMIDELTVENAMFPAMQKYLAKTDAAPARRTVDMDHFGKGAGWPEWMGVAGALLNVSGDRLEATLPDSGAMIVNPALDIDLRQRRYVCCDISSPAEKPAMLVFITHSGYGAVSFPVSRELRTSVIDMGNTRGWRGRLKSLALWVPGVGPNSVQMENLWVSGEPEGRPFLQVQRIVWDHAILSVGKEEKVSALVEVRGSRGLELKDVAASLTLPKGIRCLDDETRALGTLPTGTVKTVEWTLMAETATNGEVTVVLRAPDGAQASKRSLLFAGSFTQLTPVTQNTGATYYVDSVNGVNTGSGTSPDAPWKDFTNINGKTLGAGDRLLIRRGSVINQMLQVSARGTRDNWAEIGAYGTGPRPVIRRNWDIRDRCVLITDPDYLWIHSVVVTCAGSGIYVHCSQPNHAGLFIDDCIASHIEGRYGGYLNSTGIPEWHDLPELNPAGYCGIMVGGRAAQDITFSNCEMFHTSSGFLAKGEWVTLDRIFCHDCYVHNTSPHPVLDGRHLMLQNCIFDASGGHASRGTMGIMLADPRGLTIRNCTFRNIPDSGSGDQGGIDFEAGGDSCLIDGCTFENNAGAAIEVLGMGTSPQVRNVEISNSRFIKNSWVKTSHGPAEIFIYGEGNLATYCSTGTIHNNGYVLVPDVKFFVNKASATWSRWTLSDNVQYATVEELRKAMPLNDPPAVEAGDDIYSDHAVVQLAGTVTDDTKPADKRLQTRWETFEGPATVTFENDADPKTKATFAAGGDYLLRLVGDDGELWTSDMVAVHVLPGGTSVAKAWEFNRQLDKEGWTEENLGIHDRKEGPKYYEVTKPVKYVSGGYYIVTVDNSDNACLLSGDDLGVDIGKHKTIRVRFQNHTPATRMRFSFTTAARPDWDGANSQIFDVTPNDNGPREYAVDMSQVPGWNGTLKQLRFDLATGSALTGTCRIDYIWIDSSGR